MASRETENNAYSKFWRDKQRALWYVMVFSGVVNSTRASAHAPPSQVHFFPATSKNKCECDVLFTIFTYTLMHPVYPPKLCLTIVLDFSWGDCNTLEKLETMVMQNSGGGVNKMHDGLCEKREFMKEVNRLDN